MPIYFAVSHLAQLSALEVHKLYKLRVDIFVHEQKTPYAEIDDADALDTTFHVLNWDADKNLIATARVYPCVIEGKDMVQIGRVCVAENHRHQGIGEELMRQTMRLADEQFPGLDVFLEAQTKQRDFYAGMCVYAEDIRSPFNLGSIFRSAEAFGVDKVYLSPFCADPRQTRALRSGMGCIETLGWERKALDDLPRGIPVFALETGGTPISDFAFPKQGICLIGSEELGLTPEALERADYGHVSIPMKGLKASLNVGVALGVLLASWTQSVAQGKAI